ncbi:glycoside hydrolase family 15 protein, partial [Streptomyces ziwulingensis]|uniref:glycoside hydrolase family 15 protein n=1 Tax=Streptomyces ziwulingensis TaxID=1045501 RepID=UPI0031EAB137
ASPLLVRPTREHPFLPPDDPRVVGTVEAVRRELSTPDGLVRRYPTTGDRTGMDGLAGDEGAFVLCSFWLVDALALTGRVNEAHALFERLLVLRNGLGLLAEEYDPVQQRQLGNFPQAFSHMGLIQSARLLHRLSTRSTPGRAIAARTPDTNDVSTAVRTAGRVREKLTRV